jgi:hypothetical protein
VAGGGELVKSALWAVVAGAALTLGTFWLLQAFGPSGWEEAVVEATDDGGWTPSTEPGANTGPTHHLVLRTASGERFEARGKDRKLGVWSGTWLQVEVSDVGRAVQAIEVDGRRVTVDSGGLGIFLVGLVGVGMLGSALGEALESGRPILAGPMLVAGLGAGALPVLLLF